MTSKPKVRTGLNSIPRGFILGRTSPGSGEVELLNLRDLEAHGIITRNGLLGALAFLGLSDTPKTYAGFGLDLVRVKSTEDGLEFAPAGAIGGIVLPVSEALAAGALCNIWSNSGAANLRNADGTATGKAADLFVLAAVSSGNATAYGPGQIISGLTGRTPGAAQYLSSAGGVTETPLSSAGQTSQYVGKALTATTMLFLPRDPVELT